MDGSLAWPVSIALSLFGSPQAGSRAAVVPPSHAEQTQAAAASLLTWHPARPRHARGICSAHDCKYGRGWCLSCSESHTFKHACLMIYRCRYSGPMTGKFTFVDKLIKMSKLQMDVTFGGTLHTWGLCGYKLLLPFVTAERFFLCLLFLLQMEKQMSCAMGIPAPVHNPSCSSPQVGDHQSVWLPFSTISIIGANNIILALH